MTAPPPELRIEGVTFELVAICLCGKAVYWHSDMVAVVHLEPICPDFERLDPLEFITWLRRAHGIPDWMAESN